jgi:hypothetical protein
MQPTHGKTTLTVVKGIILPELAGQWKWESSDILSRYFSAKTNMNQARVPSEIMKTAIYQ